MIKGKRIIDMQRSDAEMKCEIEDLRAEIKRLREVLEMVEWVAGQYDNLCPWCLHSEEYGHDNCPRQTALEAK